MLKFAFLVNPVSGGGKGGEIFRKISEVLARLSFSPEEFYQEFTRRGETVCQAKKLAPLTEKLIAVGGDGTVAQVIAGAYQSRKLPLIGIIPLGVGNDLARVCGTYDLFKKQGLEGCIQQFLKDAVTALDLWQVNKKEYLTNYLGIGFDARVVHSFSRKRWLVNFSSVLLKQVVYAIMGIFYSFSRLKGKIILTCQEGKQEKSLDFTGGSLVVVSNIPLYAGGALLVSQGDWRDSLLEVTFFPELTSLLKFFLFQKVFKFLPGYGNKVEHHYAHQIEILAPSGNYLQIDGEDKTYLLAEGKLTLKYRGQVLLLCGDKTSRDLFRA